MSMYVFAPAGPRELRNNLLRVAIEYIGSKQKGIGSPWAKGKRYLRNQLSCSGTAIKRACAVENKNLNHDFQQYGTSVYYYQKRDCARIVEAVMSYIADHINAEDLPQIFGNHNFSELVQMVYNHRISQVEWVSNMNYKEQGSEAEIVYENLDKLR